VAYRDLKPENILVDRDGYVKVVDLGFAKALNGRSCTFCGTPDYMAPEILQFKPHDFSVDVWALGVLMYEMTVGHAPFTGDDTHATFKNILAYEKGLRSLDFPWFFSWATKDLTGELLVHAASRPTMHALKQHAYFGDIDWLALERRKMPAPYVPKLENEYDISHFEAFEEDSDDDESDNDSVTKIGAGGRSGTVVSTAASGASSHTHSPSGSHRNASFKRRSEIGTLSVLEQQLADAQPRAPMRERPRPRNGSKDGPNPRRASFDEAQWYQERGTEATGQFAGFTKASTDW